MSLKRKRNMEDILKSKSIKFIIGSRKAEFTVHSCSLATLSQPLHSSLGPSRPGEVEEIVTWRDVEPATFISLMEYAYTRDYSIPKLSKRANAIQITAEGTFTGTSKTEEASDIGRAPSPAKAVVGQRETSTDEIEGPDSLHTWMLKISKDRNSSQKLSAQYKFCQQHFAINESGSASAAWLQDIQQQHRTGYQTVFQTHRNLYILADKYSITELKDICLHRIRLTLMHAPCTEELAVAVFHFVRVVYAKTNHNDPLRSLLVKFCITDMEWMMREGDGQIASLLRSVPAFAADLLLEIPHDYWVEIRDGEHS